MTSRKMRRKGQNVIIYTTIASEYICVPEFLSLLQVLENK